ncbi:DUF4442 domain-containing protein [Natronosalvus caseinilyticus]|uniref:DUF4442 domain-containing protein n=1 Tax=Natronosalvus caseinilyticus TaxID=2953747 RepID=UPI0028AAB2D4|nr:DUF4442 domain-containing protein [Natronosalvus caseinilyticus]
MPESLRTKLARYRFNLFPAYRLAGGRVRYIASDWQEVRVSIPRSWRTKNVFGTTFGGSIYAAIDPIYAMMLIQALEDSYVVWDRGATIEFEKPGKETLYARFRLPDAELEEIESILETESSTTRTYAVDIVAADGTRHARAEKEVYVGTDESKRA